MSTIWVCPLSAVAETVTKQRAGSLISLLGEGHAFHRPALIPQDRHLHVGVNDIVAEQQNLVHPQERHVAAIIDFARTWDRSAPVVIHCWMGISRSPAAALIAALALAPDQDDHELARRLRVASPSATPNASLVAIGDELLKRDGRLVSAVGSIGRGVDALQGSPFRFDMEPERSPGV